MWEIPLDKGEACNSIHLVNGGKNILFSTQLSAKLVSIATKEVLWEMSVDSSKEELHSVYPHKNGGASIFISGTPARVVELSKDLKTTTEKFTFETGGTNKHAMFRQCIIAKNGNYLISMFPKKSIVEMTPEGKTVNIFEVGGTAFGARETSKGTLMLGMGDKHSIIEYDPNMMGIVREIKGFNNKEISLLYMSQVEEISKGKYMSAIWSGHNKKPLTSPAPQLFIFNDDLEIEWMWDNKDVNIGKISAFHYSKKPIVK